MKLQLNACTANRLHKILVSAEPREDAARIEEELVALLERKRSAWRLTYTWKIDVHGSVPVYANLSITQDGASLHFDRASGDGAFMSLMLPLFSRLTLLLVRIEELLQVD